MCEQLIKHFNKVYKEKGFYGVIDELRYKLPLGCIFLKRDGLYCIITRGWSENEEIVDALTHMCSFFGEKHYVGYLCGGTYYFAEDTDNDFEITLKEHED